MQMPEKTDLANWNTEDGFQGMLMAGEENRFRTKIRRKSEGLKRCRCLRRQIWLTGIQRMDSRACLVQVMKTGLEKMRRKSRPSLKILCLLSHDRLTQNTTYSKYFMAVWEIYFLILILDIFSLFLIISEEKLTTYPPGKL